MKKRIGYLLIFMLTLSFSPLLIKNANAAVNMSIDVTQVIRVNNLAVGFNLDHNNWINFRDRTTMQQLARDAGFKLIRQFDFRSSPIMPCTHWSDTPSQQTWDWTYVDQLTQKIFDVGAEPLYCLGWPPYRWSYPPDMTMNSTSGLPNKNSYANYCKAWVTHFKSAGKPVRYYEISNEPAAYFGYDPVDKTKLGYFITLWNTCASAMRSENSAVRLSFAHITMIRVLDYWLTHGGGNIDYLDTHKYDESTNGAYTDAQVFARAENWKYTTLYGSYGVDDAKQKWFNARGKWLPFFITENTFCSGTKGGTDPRIQQMAGAVDLALGLRTGMLKGLSYNLYYAWASSKSGHQGTGYGFGMINSDNNQPWYPYYVNKMIGSNLAVGDKIVKADSSSNDIRNIAWIHQGTLNILLINKVTGQRTITLTGVSGQFSVSWIDKANPIIQTRQISSNTLSMNGYTVALLQQAT